MEHCMLDLETMGNTTEAPIIAIGAVMFDIQNQILGEEFYVVVDLESSVKCGGVMDASTVLWWMKQSDKARKAFDQRGISIDLALTEFHVWLAEQGPTDQLKMWGNGAAFDNVILAGAYRRASQPVPWKFWNDRCYRTIKALAPQVEFVRSGTAHNAADDAVSQAQHLLDIIGSEVGKKDPGTGPG